MPLLDIHHIGRGLKCGKILLCWKPQVLMLALDMLGSARYLLYGWKLSSKPPFSFLQVGVAPVPSCVSLIYEIENNKRGKVKKEGRGRKEKVEKKEHKMSGHSNNELPDRHIILYY